MEIAMRTMILVSLIAGGFAMGGAPFADPPHQATGQALPPGLAKRGRVPPGHAKMMWKRGEHLPLEYRDYRFDDWRDMICALPRQAITGFASTTTPT
jgi:hypothetical protein